MSSFQPIRDPRPWDDDRFPMCFMESGNNTTVLLTGGRIIGSEDAITSAYESSTSLKDFIDKCRQAGLKVQTSELFEFELDSHS